MLLERYHGRLPVREMCKLARISSSAYYDWRLEKMDSDEEGESDRALIAMIEAIVLKKPGYGYRRIGAQLRRQGRVVNHKRLLRLMRKHNLIKKKRRRVPRARSSEASVSIFPNLVKDLALSGPDQLWVSDITYIRQGGGFVYLAAVLDAFSRKVVGWSLGKNMTSELSLSALKMAIARRSPGPGLIHHSDRGSQYACGAYVSHLCSHNIGISMSRPGNPYDNAKAESFMATLKQEEVYQNQYDTFTEAFQRIAYFIEDEYNTKRLHSSLGYLSPVEFETKMVGLGFTV